MKTYGPDGRPVYYLTYSANNWETPQYGVGYATASSPLGPFTKSPTNPILSQNASIGMYSTGHGSFAVSPDWRQLYYVHHGRPSPTEPQRRLYTERAFLDPGSLGLSIDQATSDRPIPSGVAPYSMRRLVAVAVPAVAAPRGRSRGGSPSADGALLALGNPLNRVRATSADPGAWLRSSTPAAPAGRWSRTLRAAPR